MKKIMIVLFALLLAGCAKGPTEGLEVPKPETDELVITTPVPTETPNANTEGNGAADSSETKHKYVGYGVVDADYEFFIEGNPCVFDDYILIRLFAVATTDDNQIGFEVGSHCGEDNSVQGGVTNMKMDNLDEQPDFTLKAGEIYKLYYELPDGFEPSTYLNYVDYATKLGEVE